MQQDALRSQSSKFFKSQKTKTFNSFKMENSNRKAKKEEINYVYEKPKSVCNIFALINEENRRNASVRNVLSFL